MAILGQIWPILAIIHVIGIIMSLDWPKYNSIQIVCYHIDLELRLDHILVLGVGGFDRKYGSEG